MSPIMQLVSLLRYGLLLVLLTGSTSLPAQDGQLDAGTRTAGSSEALYTQLNSSSLYERGKALDALMSVAPDEPGTVAALIRQLQSPDAEEVRFSDFIQRVERALQGTASKTTWSSGNVELLTAVLVHNDAYDARATHRTASTVAGVARYQIFTRQAIDDLTTVLWYRVDKNPNRTRGDNTRSYVVQALRQISKRQGLPRSVLDACVASLGSERNSGVRRELVLLIDDYARSQPASEAMVQALTETLSGDDKAAVRSLAARSLRGISAQRDYPRSLQQVLQRAVAGDADAAVRREALAGLMAAAAAPSRSPEVLPPAVIERLLQDAADPGAPVRFQAIEALGTVAATQTLGAASLAVLLERLREERDTRVRIRIADTLLAIHAQQGLDPAVAESLVPLVTDDPERAVRRSLSRLFVESTAGQDLASWMKATAGMGLSPADAASTIALPDASPQNILAAQGDLRARLLKHYVSALSEGRDPTVRAEILQGLFTLSLTKPLPPAAVAVLERSLSLDAEAGLRLQVTAVLLHNSLRHQRESTPFYPALDDGDAQVHTYAAFAVVELTAVDGDVLPGLLDYASDTSVHRKLREYSLRRLALWRVTGRDLPDAVQSALLELTGEPDADIRAEAWNALSQFDLDEQVWRRAAEDDDFAIRRLAWRKLEAQGVAKPVWEKWRDPKQRLQLIAVGLLGTTVLALVVGAVLFSWRLLLWWAGGRQQRGKLLAAQLLWLIAALLTVALDGGLVFIVAVSHVGLSVKDLMQLNTVLGVILVSYTAVTYLCWKLLPAGSEAEA